MTEVQPATGTAHYAIQHRADDMVVCPHCAHASDPELSDAAKSQGPNFYSEFTCRDCGCVFEVKFQRVTVYTSRKAAPDSQKSTYTVRLERTQTLTLDVWAASPDDACLVAETLAINDTQGGETLEWTTDDLFAAYSELKK